MRIQVSSINLSIKYCKNAVINNFVLEIAIFIKNTLLVLMLIFATLVNIGFNVIFNKQMFYKMFYILNFYI